MRAIKKILLPLLQCAVTIYILSWIFGSPSLRENAKEVLARADFFWLAASVLAALTSELACATRWWVILGSFQMPIRWREAVAFCAIGLFYSLALPGAAGGDAVRALYGMRLYPAKKVPMAFSILADRLCGSAAMVLTLTAVLVWRRDFFSASGLAGGMVLGAAVLLGGTTLMVGLWGVTTIPALRRFMSRRRSFLSAHFMESGDSLIQLVQRPGAILRGIALSVISLGAHFLCYYFSARAFDAGLGVGQVFSIMPVVDTLTTLPIALYGVGLREVLFNELLGTFFGIPAAMATIVSLGGFGAQALVALSGIGFLPFVRLLGIREKA